MKKIVVFLVFLSNLFATSYHEGIIYSKEEVSLSFPLDGVISKIYLKDGDNVKKDETILKLDDELQKLEVLRKKEIFNDNSEYIANQNNLKIIEDSYKSTKKLYEKTASVSRDELNSIQIQYESLLGKVNTHKARKEQEKLEYEISKEVLKKYSIKSPINGVISDLKYHEGEWAKMGEVVVKVVDVDNCYIELNIEEPIARNLKLNSKAIISSNEDTIIKQGTIYYISAIAESTSALIKIRIKFKNDAPKITPGVMGKISFENETEGKISAK